MGPIPIPLSDDITAAKTARGNWARFIKKVFELDPLLCPDCGGLLKIEGQVCLLAALFLLSWLFGRLSTCSSVIAP